MHRPRLRPRRPRRRRRPRLRSRPRSAPSVVPFLRGSGRGKYKFYSKAGLTHTAATQDLGPIDIKAYDYMRSILVTYTTTAVGGALGTLSADGPFNAFTNVSVLQPNGQTMYQVSSGYRAAMIQKYGQYRGANDPRADPIFSGVQGSATSTATFAFRIPFEMDLRDALGALPNKDAAAPFSLNLTLNTLSNVFGASEGTSNTFTVEAWLEAYDQPPSVLNGAPVQTTPPNMNTLQRWTEQSVTMSTGQFDVRLRKLEALHPDAHPDHVQQQQRADRHQRVGRPGADRPRRGHQGQRRRTTSAGGSGRQWGYGGSNQGSSSLDGTGGQDTGVWPIQYCFDERDPHVENANLYLPTIESEDYLLRGSWGSACSTLRFLVGEVLPQGNIFGFEAIMPTGLGGNGASSGGGITITYAFAGLVLLALAGLIVLRHLTGTISISR